MGGTKTIGKNSPQSNFHMGGHYVPPLSPTLICNSDVPPSWGLMVNQDESGLIPGVYQ